MPFDPSYPAWADPSDADRMLPVAEPQGSAHGPVAPAPPPSPVRRRAGPAGPDRVPRAPWSRPTAPRVAPDPARGAPAAAVVVPVLGAHEQLPDLLSCLAAQSWRAFEVIVVDNAPQPDLRVQAAAWACPGLRIRVIHCPRPGSYAARNAGVAATRAPRLAFTDADCRPEPGWLAGLMAEMDRGAALSAGPVVVQPEATPNAWAIYDTVQGIPQETFVRHGYAATANLAVSREVFERLQGFDAARFSGGDADFCRRAGTLGLPLAYVREAVVRHPARATWDELATKVRRTKGGQVRAGRAARRVAWTLRTLAPPVRNIAAYLRSPHPWRWKLVASTVRLRLWGVELHETARLLLLGTPPERR